MPRPNCLLLLACLCGLASGLVAQSSDPVRFLADYALSPDGKTVVFSWRGDLWSGAIVGGDIKQLTTHPSNDDNPAFSPDGREIAFRSDRDANNQIHVMPAWGGAARRVTHDTNGYHIEAWWPNGDGFLTHNTRDHWFRDASRFYHQPLDGTTKPELLFDAAGEQGVLDSKGQRLLFTREGAPVFRKRYEGAQASQLWMYDLRTKAFTEVRRESRGVRWPLFGAEDSTYYFVSQATGTWNLYRGNLGNQEVKQLTSFHGDGVMFPTISSDASTILFSRGFALYALNTADSVVSRVDFAHQGGVTIEDARRVNWNRSTDCDLTKDGREVAFLAGGDLWVMDTVLKDPVRVTDSAAEERDVLFSDDMKSLYVISDRGGQSDLWKITRKDEEKFWWQSEEFQFERLTEDGDTEGSLRLWDDGKRLAYYRDQSLWSIELATGEATELVKSWNRPSYDFSPDAKWIVYSIEDGDYNDDVWIRPLDGSREPFNLSCHPDDDRNPVWSADGRFIAFTGRRWDRESDIVWVPLTKEAAEETSRDRELKQALDKMKGRKKGGTKKPAASKPDAAPEAQDPVSGTWTGSSKGGPLPASGLPVTMELKLAKSGGVTGTATSPMGTFSVLSGRFDADTGKITLVFDADGEEMTITGTIEGNTATGTWTSLIGTGTFELRREASEAEPKDQEAAKPETAQDQKKDDKSVRIDFDGLRDRLRRISLNNSFESGLRFSAKGSTLYFRGTVGGRGGTHKVTFPDKLAPTQEKASLPSSGNWMEDGKSLATNSGGRPGKVTLGGKSETYNFNCRVTISLGASFAAIFDQAWRVMRDRFYDEALGGNDWDAIRKHYRPHAEACRTTGELSLVCNAMLGELNGSHLGFRLSGRGNPYGTPSTGSPDQWGTGTTHLGARFDEQYKGPGLKVKDVIEGTPAAAARSALHAGDIIVSVDGQPVRADQDPALWLTVEPDHEFLLEVQNSEGEQREVTLKPTSAGFVRSRLYEHWIKSNREEVARQSDGRFGYLHIQGMSFGNLLRFDTELYRLGHGKDGIVIDVRENGGGSITDHLLTCLTQPSHALTRARGSTEIGYPQDRRIYATWDKPIVVLCNQNSFSNAEIFAHAIKHLGRGKVVGVTTAGGVISTGGTSLMGGAFIRLPFRGWYLIGDGEDMELNGCQPHAEIWPWPGEILAGTDRQLNKAIELLEADVKAAAAKPQPKLRKSTDRRPGGASPERR